MSLTKITDPEQGVRTVSGVWTTGLEDREGVQAYLAYQTTKSWEEFAVPQEWMPDYHTPPLPPRNIFWTPALYTGVRTRENALPVRWLWADLDAEYLKPALRFFPPHFTWQTSAGRWQALWFLVTAFGLDVDLWENLNRRLTYFVGADKGGWSITKYLRFPFTPNYKYNPARPGGPMYASTHDPYFWEDVDNMLAPVDEDPRVAPIDIPPRPESLDAKTLEPRVRMALSRKWVPDRSQHIYFTLVHMRGSGVPKDAAFWFVYDAPFNKFSDRPDQLWREVLSVYS